MLGYSLHLPYPSLHNIKRYTSYDQYLKFYGIDVLQCIGFGLLLLLLLRFINNEKTYSYIVLFLGLVIFFLTPIIKSLDLSFIPLPILVYIQPIHYSLFPVFPWVSYIFLGAFFSYLYYNSLVKDSLYFLSRTIIKLFLTVSVINAVLFYFILNEDPKTSYSFFALKLSIVILIMFSLNIFFDKYKDKSFPIIEKFGRYSLLVYWFHLVLLYKKIRDNFSLVELIGQNMSFYSCFLISVIIIFCCLGLICFWESIKRNKFYTRITYIGIFLLASYIFFFTYY